MTGATLDTQSGRPGPKWSVQFDPIPFCIFYLVEEVGIQLFVKSLSGDSLDLGLQVNLALIVATDVVLRMPGKDDSKIHQTQGSNCLRRVRPRMAHVNIIFYWLIAVHTG